MSSKNRYGSKYLRIFHHFFTISRYLSKYLRIFHHFFTISRYLSKYLRIFHHFFTISRYRSKYLRIFSSFFHNKSILFKKSTDLPSFFSQRMWFSFLIYITDISYFKKSTYYFGISSSLDSLFIHLWPLPPHQRFHLLFGWSSTSWSVKQATSLQ